MKCIDCPHFHIVGDLGMARCDKLNLVIDFADFGKLKTLECVETKMYEPEKDRNIDLSKEKYAKDKEYLACHALDMFTKIFCINENADDLEFECDGCEFVTGDDRCLLKQFVAHRCPEYRDFGAMGDL